MVLKGRHIVRSRFILEKGAASRNTQQHNHIQHIQEHTQHKHVHHGSFDHVPDLQRFPARPIKIFSRNFTSGGATSSSSDPSYDSDKNAKASSASGSGQSTESNENKFASEEQGANSESSTKTTDSDPNNADNFSSSEDGNESSEQNSQQSTSNTKSKAEQDEETRKKLFDEFIAKPPEKNPDQVKWIQHARLRQSEMDMSRGESPGLNVNRKKDLWEEKLDEGEDALDLVRERPKCPGQILYPATKEDVEILINSVRQYPNPRDCEGSTLIRLVRLSDPVTSPVARVMRNRQFGIRGTERFQILGLGIFCASIVFSLGCWQLERMQWKKETLKMRAERLTDKIIRVNRSPFPWTDRTEDYVYRCIEIRGVFDHRKEMLVGPRTQADANDVSSAGMLVVTPLRLPDGSSVLINRGFLGRDQMAARAPEVPGWVRVRGVLESAEIPEAEQEDAT